MTISLLTLVVCAASLGLDKLIGATKDHLTHTHRVI